jgi:hypothetical protein
MKKKSTSKSAPARRSLGEGGFINLRVLIAALLCLTGVFIALLASGAFSSAFAQAKNSRSTTQQDAPGTQTPDVVHLIGPAVVTNLRDLPYFPSGQKYSWPVLMRHLQKGSSEPAESEAPAFPRLQSLLGRIFHAIPNIPPPLLTFDGMSRVGPPATCNCLPPDTIGDVGPNHYVQTVNEAIRVFDKSGNPVGPVTSFDSFFSPLGATTPCGAGLNHGDPFVLYDHMADRWLISDFAFDAGTLAGPFYQCIGVSQTGDPTGAYNLYALQVDAAHPTWVGDYPKFALWNNPQPGGAYHFTVNLFNFVPSFGFDGVRVFALDRAAMLAGLPNPTVVAFTVSAADVGLSYSFLAAGFRTGNPPPVGRDEMELAINSSAMAGDTETQVHARFFHVDFGTPANSTFGVGPTHAPNAEITVDGFINAAVSPGFDTNIVPQLGTAVKLDTVGDRLFTPLVYQNLNGTESLWVNHPDLLNYPEGPVAVRWYQFDVTGGVFPATPVQQQSWDNDGDGLWRWMAALAVDEKGGMTLGYSTSSPSIFPSIRYAGRLASDPLNNLGQGEAILQAGGSNQTHASGRWGDYSMVTVDPSDGLTFYITNEYYPDAAATMITNWHTSVGKFNFPPTSLVRSSPTPRPHPTVPPRP